MLGDSEGDRLSRIEPGLKPAHPGEECRIPTASPQSKSLPYSQAHGSMER